MDREEGHLPFVRLIARGKQFPVYPLHARKNFRDFPPLLGYVKRNDGLYPLDTQGNGACMVLNLFPHDNTNRFAVYLCNPCKGLIGKATVQIYFCQFRCRFRGAEAVIFPCFPHHIFQCFLVCFLVRSENNLFTHFHCVPFLFSLKLF